MKIKRIAEILDAEVILGQDSLDTEIETVCSSDLMSDLLHFSTRHKSLLITGLTNSQVVRTADIADIKAIVFVLNKRPDKDTVALAKEKNIALLVSPLSRFTACGKLYSEGLRSCVDENR
jgi:predicted transcriptional regulator